MPDVRHDDLPPALPAVVSAYREETARVVRARLVATVELFLLFMGGAVGLEGLLYPTHFRPVLLAYGAEAFACGLALAACRHPRLAGRAPVIGATLAATLAVLMSVYNAAVAGFAERLAMAEVCLLSGVVVLVPAGWRAQLAIATASVASLVFAAPYLQTPDNIWFTGLAFVVAATTSVFGALFLDRYRYEAFVRAAHEREETEIIAALLHVGETLDAHLDQPDMLERVNRVAVETLGCDWSSTFVWNAQRRAFRLGANAGSRPEIVTEMQQLEFGGDSFPLMLLLRGGEEVELADVERQTLVPVLLQRRLEVASALYVPLMRREHIVGVLICGYRTRTGPFSATQRRLARGIAHLTAIALQNARLITDLQAANALKSDFVSTMSHELRTPLNVITGYVEVMADGAFGPLTPEQEDGLGRIRRSAVELLDLVSATLDLGRLEAGRDTLRVEPVDLDALVAALRADLGPLVQSGVVVTWENTVGSVPVATDGVKVRTILKNLVGNALKFTPAGEVTVRVARDGADLVLTVCDTGIGIAAADLPTIFEMFRQVDGSSTRHYGGVGLGLYIVKRLLEQLGGTVDVESTVGVGSTFTVRLPVESDPVRLTGT